MGFRDYVIRRLLLLIPLILGITLLLYILTNVVLDPVTVYLRNPNNYRFIEQIKIKYGLDQPHYIRYFTFLYNLLIGDWGTAVSDQNRPVLSSLALYFPATFELTVAAMILLVGLGIPTGIISATRKDKPVDHATRVVALSGISLPTFWLGLMLQLLFATQFRVWGLPSLPFGGQFSPWISVPRVTGLSVVDAILTGNQTATQDALTHLILPAFTLGFVGFGVLTRIVRASMLEVLRQDYITLARSKGLSERIVIYKHALRNAMIPTLTLIGLFFAGLLGGAVLTESIFTWPGIGRFAANSVLQNDTASILGFTILISLIYIIGNLIVDLLYAYVDPRIKLS